ncbi:hypothetical protein TRFO_15847 [Tritrichomonas foetus]|uniref:Uncharacterized protein n=1 Tax=Tritrichomonas foetus TaxID=1144522 RepID=A0A1J4KWD8_9EUKA|nr:hypothetical protein TRFO_15847 [Tritrichomonas foetus]|eukprot:OHT13845.1 hypothetical protein TRFO_15847 [Tritrichomonas foetus]
MILSFQICFYSAILASLALFRTYLSQKKDVKVINPLIGDSFAVGDYIFHNLSLGKNYEDFTCRNESFLHFTPNRKVYDKAKVIYNLMVFYPESKMEQTLDRAKYFIKQISEKYTPTLTDSCFLLITVNYTVRNLSQTFDRELFTKESIHRLDYGYRFFQQKNILIFQTSIQQNLFSREFLESRHFTQVRHYPFTAHYAACFGILVYLPFMLQIYDYFDYFGRVDIDFDRFNLNYSIFPDHIISQNKDIHLIGCYHRLDCDFVSINVYKMIFEYLISIGKKCNNTLYHSENFFNGYIHSETQSIPGAFQLIWLGLYSSPEIRSYAKFFVSYKDGIPKNRWGDQQFYFMAFAMFSSKEHIRYDRNLLFCRHQQLK